MLLRFLKDLFNPPSPWRGCQPLSEYGRMASYERRLGRYWLEHYEKRAKEWERLEGVSKAFDMKATVRPKIEPKLPSDNVLYLKRQA